MTYFLAKSAVDTLIAYKFEITVALLLALIVIMFFHFKHRLVELESQQLLTSKIASRTDTVIFNLNDYGARLSKLDGEVSSLVPFINAKVKSTFVSKNYLNELKLYKSLSSKEQQEYMSMSKEAKRSKYAHAL